MDEQKITEQTAGEEILDPMTEQETPVSSEPQEDLNHLEYADAVIECGCGHVTKIQHPQMLNIQGGINLPLLARKDTLFGLHCEKCDAKLMLKFVEAANPPVKEAEVIEEEENVPTSEGVDTEPIENKE